MSARHDFPAFAQANDFVKVRRLGPELVVTRIKKIYAFGESGGMDYLRDNKKVTVYRRGVKCK